MKDVEIIAEICGLEQCKAALAGGEADIFFSLEYGGFDELTACLATSTEADKKFTAITPVINSEGTLGPLLRELQRLGVENLSVGSIGALGAASEKGFNLSTEASMNVFNSESLMFLKEIGVSLVTASHELNLKEIRILTRTARKIGVELACIVHGDVVLMTSKQCLAYNFIGPGVCSECQSKGLSLRDARGFRFPVMRTRSCTNQILNSRELRMDGQIGRLVSNGISNLRFNFCHTAPERIKEVLKCYRDDMALSDAGSGFTRGHYFRGVE
ncbi:peptidase family U32 [archaeon BMS3Bbin16]|nr:peptidase family U32 [archaeon BMS3Bbin16]